MRWFLTWALVLGVATQVQAASLRAMLVRASDQAPADAALKDLQPQLKKQFGYQYYRLLGKKQDKLKLKTTTNLDVGEGFSVAATLKSTKKRVQEIHIQWMSGSKTLVTTDVKMSEGGHVFIKGPGVGKDWIVLTLSVLP
jgi:hypothetical protein